MPSNITLSVVRYAASTAYDCLPAEVKQRAKQVVFDEVAGAQVRSRIALHGDAEPDRDQPDGRGATVAIKTVGDSTVSMCIDHPKGHSKRDGLTRSELAAKWHAWLPECDVDKLLSIAQRLDDVEDFSHFLEAVW